MPVKAKGRGKLHALHHGKAGAVHEAEILVPVFAEDIPGPLLIGGRNRNYPDETALLQLLPESARGFMADSIANKGDCFKEYGGQKGTGYFIKKPPATLYPVVDDNLHNQVPLKRLYMNGNMEITEQVLTGAAIAEALDDLATLRLDIFPEYPYLYQGRREDELTYLATYAEAPDACVILAYDGLTVIGAATGMPLIHEDAQMIDAFAGTTFPLNEVYYVGELLFRPDYRNCGLGQKLLDRLENHIRSLGRYRRLTCATVERPEDHPLRPRDYIPITRFLARTGFVRLPGVSTSFTWRETDGVKRDHLMQFWIKNLI